MATITRHAALLEESAAPTIRPYRPSDAGAIRRIWRSTLALGSPVSFEIGSLAAYRRLCVEWYLDPRSLEAGRSDAVVVESAGDVVGYLLACLDEDRFRRWQWRQAVRWTLGAAVRYPRLAREAQAFVRSRFVDGWRGLRMSGTITSTAPDAVFPAHMHFNLDPHVRGNNIGHELAAWMDERVRRAGLAGYMGEINVPAGRSLRALEAAGVVVVARTPNRTFSRLLGVPVDRCLVSRDLSAVPRPPGPRP